MENVFSDPSLANDSRTWRLSFASLACFILTIILGENITRMLYLLAYFRYYSGPGASLPYDQINYYRKMKQSITDGLLFYVRWYSVVL